MFCPTIVFNLAPICFWALSVVGLTSSLTVEAHRFIFSPLTESNCRAVNYVTCQPTWLNGCAHLIFVILFEVSWTTLKSSGSDPATGCDGVTRTRDLLVMSQTSYHCSTPLYDENALCHHHIPVVPYTHGWMSFAYLSTLPFFRGIQYYATLSTIHPTTTTHNVRSLGQRIEVG